MHTIQKDLVHRVKKGRCGNCGQQKEAHAGGACLFDFTTFREESASDHLDCECESIIEEDNSEVKPDGTLKVEAKLTSKKPINFISMSFTV